MKYFDLLTSYPDHTIAAAWESQIKEADRSPWLADTLMESGDELFARFAACYAELRALPRSARRALQRRLSRSGEIARLWAEYPQHGGRQLQHRMAWSLAGAALLLALAQEPVAAATITVTTSNPNIAADGQCSLVEAIVNANNDAATHADCPAGSGADTIVLPTNANIALSNAYGTVSYITHSSPIGLPPIASRITIEGNGAVIFRAASAADFRVLAVNGSGDLTLQGLTISAGGTHGGVTNSGKLNIQSSIISGNTGRGVSNSGTLTVENSIISNNTDFLGGGLYNTGSTTIIKSTISGNVAGSSGGGVYNFYGTLTIENSTVSNNSATVGGGALNLAGGLRITNSTISGNRANRAGGVSNSEYCYFYCTPGTLTLQNSLIAGNEGSIAPEIENAMRRSSLQLYSIVNANNFNLFGANGNAGVAGFAPGPRDIVPSASLGNIMGPLTNNGGPTPTHPLVPGSPAVDAGDPTGCRDSQGSLLTTDQRGLPRTFDGNRDGSTVCDIGAYEQNELFPALAISDVIVTEGNAGTVNATFEVKLSEPSTEAVTVTFNTANRTATAGLDYAGTSGTLTFNPGETTKTITVAVNANNILELDKSFLVNITSATNAIIADGQAIGTIVNDDGVPPERLANISTRSRVLTGDNVMIGGFIIDGSTPKKVLVRSRGPSMAGAPFFVPGTLANPAVRIFSGPTVIAQNDNWQDSPNCPGFVCEGAVEIMNTGFDPCTPNPGQDVLPPGCTLEAAILITLPPGAYTAIVAGADSSTGVALVEVFEADASVVSELGNISARAFVQSGDNVMIGGLIIDGSAPATVLLRARGPSMSGAPFFVPGTLANPFLQLFSGQGVIAQNDNWQDIPSCGGLPCGGAAPIAATGLDPCQPNPGQSASPPGCAQESAIFITLPPGAYTAIVSGVGGATGVGLVEVFELD